MKISKICPVVVAMALGCAASASAASRGFAIFVDSLSNSKVAPELAMYAESVKGQGLAPEIVVIGEGIKPDSIRSIIRTMSQRKTAPIEGMVFVGDIPIPMLLDAQHFSSAFKVVQSPKNLERSACPSDRFYDDLELKFDYVCQDEKKPGLYYYSLRPDSPQRVAPTLYSGRIKSMDFYGKDKYENLRDYLKKVVRVKQQGDQLDNMLYFSGQGYNSESAVARIDEKLGHLEQFPWMRGQSQALTYLDHKHNTFTKYLLMSQMQRPDLSLALLHHHGSPKQEYINRYPDPRSTKDQLEAANRFFRSKIRSAVDRGTPLDSAKMYYVRNFDVPFDWFDDVMTPASIAADSIYDDQLDLHIYDFGKYKPNARVVMLDACFNGAFNNPEYIAGGYIFGDGDCVVAIANSVNSLQDKWCDKNIGLLGLGMRVGNFVKYNPYLESHVIGDPTFAFMPKDKLGYDLNASLNAPVGFWKKQLASSPYPAVRSLAIEKLVEAGEMNAAGLLDTFKTSDSYLVRLAAMMLLSRQPGQEFVEVIKLGLNDGYELIRRFSAVFAGKNGSPELLPAVVKAYSNELKGERVNFQLQMAMPLFDYDALIAELEAQRPYKYAYDEADMMNKAKESIADRFSSKKYEKEVEMLKSAKPDAREMKAFVRQMRNNPLHPSVDELLAYIDTCDNDELRVSLVEALGWFNYSYRAPQIAARLKDVSKDEKFSAKVRSEAAKSAARLGSPVE
ncbi:MAG: HEAT repeat domain-containing protein [Bacteroides sp.]|nr:HEAT repeat domain-containing protein [Bacteroides sp.]